MISKSKSPVKQLKNSNERLRWSRQKPRSLDKRASIEINKK